MMEDSGSTPEAGEGARVALLEAEVAQLRRQWHQECDNFERECNRADAAERERDAALAALASRETYTEEGGLIVVGQLREQRARAEAAEAEVERLRGDYALAAKYRDEYRDDAHDASEALLNMIGRLEATEAVSARLASVVAKVEALHFAYTLYESCPDYVTGCDDDACTENPHDGEWFHSDQPVGRVCGECNDEDGEPVEFPCPTLAALASVGVSGSADDRREANASQAPDTATPGEAECRGEGETCLTHGGGWIFNDDGTADVCESADLYPAASSADDKAGEGK